MTMESEHQDDMRHLAAACRQVYEKLSLALCDLSQVALRYLLLFQAVRCQCSATWRKCVEHAKCDCQEMMCSHFATLPLLAEDVRKRYPSRPPVFCCPEKSKFRAVVANQAEMKMYWLSSRSEIVSEGESSFGEILTGHSSFVRCNLSLISTHAHPNPPFPLYPARVAKVFRK